MAVLIGVLAVVAVVVVCLPIAGGQISADAEEGVGPMMPVSAVREGIGLDAIHRIKANFSLDTLLLAGDVALYYNGHVSEFHPSSVIRRNGSVAELPVGADVGVEIDIGSIRANTSLGEMSLDDFLRHPASRMQAFLVIHRGAILFEAYPGMRPEDLHLWMSSTKTVPSLIVGQLVDEGKVDQQEPLSAYIPYLADKANASALADIKVIDALDMRLGLDVEETQATQRDPSSGIRRVFAAEFGEPNPEGQVLPLRDVLLLLEKLHAPGEVVGYTSAATQLLVDLAEAVENRTWAALVQERIWGKMGAEGDAVVALTPDGLTALGHGLFASRLRDFGRYGMIYTPSASDKSVVSAAYLDRIQTGGRDAVFADGDIFKGGIFGQGLYVSPGRDLVVVWFATTFELGATLFAREVAKALA
ncbi:unnamed protein product [Vitrella brassicaformis CCMP3155]|uniref:Beta-lactamase-related domain-containing protein n=1 Tax=Vitrella brassicaformis (strain CCMP3155) TaxID=1169540 RepID=A0A0G4FNP7_VITBC|nr:unnamed protein product [Vitrella brassicaformis CCMP3155]|eukprot:CEM15845.1 unnamed protein product [Vitrella brassicaformis CCMP3155]